MSSPDIVGLRSRLAGPAPLFRIFTRLTDPVAYETIAVTDVDALIIGADLGSFGRAGLAQCIFALRCARKYVLIRLPDDNLAAIQHAVGAGADGIVVPHVHAADLRGALSTSFTERR